MDPEEHPASESLSSFDTNSKGSTMPRITGSRATSSDVWRRSVSAAIGSPVPVDELSYLSADDREARRVVDAFVESRAEAGQGREAAIAEFVRAGGLQLGEPLARSALHGSARTHRRGDPPERGLRRPLAPASAPGKEGTRAVLGRGRWASCSALRRIWSARKGAPAALRPEGVGGSAAAVRRRTEALHRVSLRHHRCQRPGGGDG